MKRFLDRGLLALGAALVVATVAVAVFAGKTDDSKPKGAQAGGGGATATATDKVTIKGFKFMPQSVTVKAGTKLTFVNNDNAAHTATSDVSGPFDTGGLPQGKSKTVTLSKPGTYPYHCDFHPFMKGTVTVR